MHEVSFVRRAEQKVIAAGPQYIKYNLQSKPSAAEVLSPVDMKCFLRNA